MFYHPAKIKKSDILQEGVRKRDVKSKKAASFISSPSLKETSFSILVILTPSTGYNKNLMSSNLNTLLS